MLSGLVKQAVAAKAELLQTIKTVLGCISVLSQVYDEHVIGHAIVSLQGLHAFAATAECQGAALTRCLCSAIIGEVRPLHRYLIQSAVRTPYVITVRPLMQLLQLIHCLPNITHVGCKCNQRVMILLPPPIAHTLITSSRLNVKEDIMHYPASWSGYIKAVSYTHLTLPTNREV